MPERRRCKVVVTGPAQRDLEHIIGWSFDNFGKAASLRYEALILKAFRDLGNNPDRLGSKEFPRIMIPEARIYHLSLSQSRNQNVKKPRHFILYRHSSEGVIEIGRILHDSRDLERHLPEGYEIN